MSTSGRRTSKAIFRREYEEFRTRLVRARESAGLTQREAAQRLGRSQSFVAKSETGERRVDVVELRQFAATYGVPLEFFFGRRL
jgi:transcriptional regulator with XRE-family HTH domain